MKKTFINAIVIDKSGNVMFFNKVKPNEHGVIKLGNNNFETTSTNTTIYKGLKTYFYTEQNNMPLTPDLTKGEYTSGEYNSGLTQTVLDKLLASLKGNSLDLKNLFYIIFGFGLLVIIGLMIYFYFTLKGSIDSLIPIITTVTTGGI